MNIYLYFKILLSFCQAVQRHKFLCVLICQERQIQMRLCEGGRSITDMSCRSRSLNNTGTRKGDRLASERLNVFYKRWAAAIQALTSGWNHLELSLSKLLCHFLNIPVYVIKYLISVSLLNINNKTSSEFFPQQRTLYKLDNTPCFLE